jgi:hypothetical protein
MATSDKMVQLLRHQMVRRLPSAVELAARQPLALTQRDQAILAAIGTHGFLSTELVDFAFFASPVGGEPVPGSRAHRRLRLLWLAGLVERIELPINRVLGGRRPFVYALTPHGVEHVPSDPADSTTTQRRVDRKDDCLSEHDAWAATLWAQMQALTRTTRLQACRWVPERELRARKIHVRDPLTERWLPVLPDGYAELEYPDSTVQCCMVEIDMGTVSLVDFGSKLRALELYLAQGLFTQTFGQSGFEVLVLTHSTERLNHLWQVGRRVVPAEAWPWYSFALFELLASSEQFGSEGWKTLRGDTTGLLYDAAHRDDAVARPTEQGTSSRLYGRSCPTTRISRDR